MKNQRVIAFALFFSLVASERWRLLTEMLQSFAASIRCEVHISLLPISLCTVLFIALHSFFSVEFIVTHTQQRAELTMQRHTHNWSVFVQPGFKWARISIFWKRSSACEAPRSDGWERPLPVFRRDRPWGVNSSVMDILWLEMLLHSRCCCHPDSLDLHLPTLSPPFLSSKKKRKEIDSVLLC